MAQAYRWAYSDILQLTYPQILMLNHAADVNRRRLDLRIKQKRNDGTATLSEEVADMPLVGGRKLTDLTSDEYISYLSSDGPRPRIIKTQKPT